MSLLNMPILTQLSWVVEGVNGLDAKLTKPQKNNLIVMLTAMILLSTATLSTIAIGLMGSISVNALSHFMNYAGLDGHCFMASAVRFAVRAMNLQGISIKLAIDDTMEHHSRFCKCIENVYNLFDHALGTYCKAKCIVFVYLIVNERIRFPIGWRVYRQGEKKKWELALELIDTTIAYGFKIHVVLFDSWYCVGPFVKELEKRNLVFISELKSNILAEFGMKNSHKKIKISISKLFEYCKDLCKNVFLGLKSNDQERPEKVLYKTHTINAYIPALGMRVKVIKSIDTRKGCYKIFVTNELSWDTQKVLEEYSYRWMIEEFFRNAKQLFGFEEASIRSEQGGAIKLFLVSFADLLVSIQLWRSAQNSSFKKLETVSAILAHAAEENLKCLLKSTELNLFEKIINNWLKICQKKQRKTRRERRSLAECNPLNAESTPFSEETLAV